MDQSKDLPNNAIKTRFVFQHHSLTYKGTTYYLQSINSIGKGGQKGKGLRESSLKTSPMTSWHCQPPLEGQQKSSQPSLKCFSLAIYKQNYLDYRHPPFKFHEAVTPSYFIADWEHGLGDWEHLEPMMQQLPSFLFCCFLKPSYVSECMHTLSICSFN